MKESVSLKAFQERRKAELLTSDKECKKRLYIIFKRGFRLKSKDIRDKLKITRRDVKTVLNKQRREKKRDAAKRPRSSKSKINEKVNRLLVLRAVEISRAKNHQLSYSQILKGLRQVEQRKDLSLSFVQNNCFKDKLKRLAILLGN